MNIQTNPVVVAIDEAPSATHVTLTDLFAAHVAGGMATNSTHVDAVTIARTAYEVADALIEIRNKRHST